MTADALTKPMLSPCLMSWLTSGCVRFWNTGHPLEMKRLPPPTADVIEDDLIEGDKALRRGRSWTSPAALFALSKRWYSFGFAMMLVYPADAQGDATSSTTTTLTTADYILVLLLLLVAAASSSITLLFNRWWSSSPTTTTSTATSEQGTWTEEDGIEKDKSTMLHVTRLEGDNLNLKTLNGSLDRELRQRRQQVRDLREELLNAPSSSSTPVQHEDIWVTKAGRKFHRQNCIYAQGGTRYSVCGHCHRNT